MSKYLRILYFVLCGFYFVYFLFSWLFISTDSHFYYLFANFFKTGSYLAPHPYYYMVPSTMEPPLYSLFVYIADLFPRGDIVLHFLQIGSIVLSSYFIFLISRKILSQAWGYGAGIVFLLTPAHLIYTSNVVAEPIAVFFLSFFLYLLFKIIDQKKINFIPLLILWSTISSFQRYNFITLYILSVFLYFTYFKKLKSAERLSLFVSIFIFVLWILMNHRLNGSWGMSNAEGKHLWNRIVYYDGLLPSSDSEIYKKVSDLLDGKMQSLNRPWWIFEEKMFRKIKSETEVSRVMQEFSLEALKTDPFKYIMNTPIFFLSSHLTNDTYHDELYKWGEGGGMDKNCVKYGSIEMCNPIIYTSYSRNAWNQIISAVDFFYFYIWKYVNILIFFPGICLSFIYKNKLIKLYSLLYISSILFFVLVESPLPRYTYNFTPIWVLIIVFFFNSILFIFRKNNSLSK